jgi:uncharacterized RDD family membrane protein YckC
VFKVIFIQTVRAKTMKAQHSDDHASINEISPGIYVDSNGQQLTEQQVRQVVTPHDFTVASALVGRPLARPWRRGLAILLDSIIIALLTSGSFVAILPVAAYLAFRCHQQLKLKQRNSVIVATLLLFVLLPFAPQAVKHNDERIVAATLLVAASAMTLTNSGCDKVCADKQLKNISKQLHGTKLSDAEVEAIVKNLLDESTLTTEQQQAALSKVMADIKQYRKLVAKQATDQLIQATTQPAAKVTWWQQLQQSDHSVLKWLQGILTDLGIGFGWAVIYFTLFISWSEGQTIGKTMLGIKVVQLNNKPLSLWQAFGRQGGYSAGLATGLLGFFQIYWDPNRQAIQDKVADTLVLQVNAAVI